MGYDVKVGQRYQDLDPRRPDRIGTVVKVMRFSVSLRWSNGRTTTVRRRMLEASGSRGYVRIDHGRGISRSQRIPSPTTARECRAGWDDRGRRRWRCWVCGRTGRLRPPWRVLVWTRRPMVEKSTVVCSGRCHVALTGGEARGRA